MSTYEANWETTGVLVTAEAVHAIGFPPASESGANKLKPRNARKGPESE